MKGLELAQNLYEECARPLFEEHCANLLPSLAFGLVGEGSECFGFDDEISRDHDWGPAFCVWIPEQSWEKAAPYVQKALTLLPEEFKGFRTRRNPDEWIGRVGPLPLEGFYRKFLNVPRAPETLAEWRRVPEHYLATATNGEVFSDPAGTFTRIREQLLSFYPEDVRLKKIAARCVEAAQAGQYNLPRMLKRCDSVSVSICRGHFMEAVISLIFLLNKRYMPFYKWAFRALKQLPLLGTDVSVYMDRLSLLSPFDDSHERFVDTIEEICVLLANELEKQGLVDDNNPWLYEQGPAVQSRIQNESLRRLPVQMD